jgi:hypothetical protein
LSKRAHVDCCERERERETQGMGGPGFLMRSCSVVAAGAHVGGGDPLVEVVIKAQLEMPSV